MSVLLKIYIVGILLCILISCTVNRESLIGKYEWQGIYGVGSNIELKSDSTFHFKWVQGLISDETYGSWKIRGNEIILNSEFQPGAPKFDDFKLIEKSSTNSDYWTFETVDRNNNQIPLSRCYLKKDTLLLNTLHFDLNGYLKTPKSEADSIIIITSSAYNNVSFKIDSNFNKFKFEISSFIDDYYRIFTEEKWKVKNGKLSDPKMKSDKFVESKFYIKID